MDDREAGAFWNENADAWTTLSRAGYDVYRDGLNTPGFLEMLPDVGGLTGLDIGCGEGHNTRLVAARGARMHALDISDAFVRYAAVEERREPRGIRYCVASGVSLPFAAGRFDFVTAFMSLMDMPSLEQVLADVFRVLRPGGFLQFSVAHPCFATPHRRNLRGADGLTYAFEVGDYFRRLEGELEEWIFSSAPPAARAGFRRFRVPRFNRTLSDWINLLTATGFSIERVAEPRPTDDTVRRYPALQDAQVVAYFLHVRVRKP